MKKKKIDSSPYGSKLNVNEWSKSRKKISDLYPSEKKFFLQKIKLSNSFIDIGCATGNFINIISKYTKIKNYLGIDISKNQSKIGQRVNLLSASNNEKHQDIETFSSNGFVIRFAVDEGYT